MENIGKRPIYLVITRNSHVFFSSVGAFLALALPLKTPKEDPYKNYIPNRSHWLYGE